jgi:hypothetical protein
LFKLKRKTEERERGEENESVGGVGKRRGR